MVKMKTLDISLIMENILYSTNADRCIAILVSFDKPDYYKTGLE